MCKSWLETSAPPVSIVDITRTYNFFDYTETVMVLDSGYNFQVSVGDEVDLPAASAKVLIEHDWAELIDDVRSAI